MPIKNYTSKEPASGSIQKIQEMLVAHGATGMIFEYEKGTGRITSLKFAIDINQNQVGFSMPVNWRLFQEVLKKQNVKRWNDEEYCYRVAWANLRDWTSAQMALLETRMVDVPQIFLPFAVGNDGKTLYEKVSSNHFLLN